MICGNSLKKRSLTMKPICPAFRTILCALAIAAATTVASATTITYFGDITVSLNSVYNVGDSWQLTVTLPDPLADTNNGTKPNDFVYAPSSVTMSIGGVILTPDLTSWTSMEALAGSPPNSGYSRYGNSVVGCSLDFSTYSLIEVVMGLGSYKVVTDSNGMLLPSVSMAEFDNNWMWYGDAIGYSFGAGGVVTNYSVVTSNAVPDASPTVALFGLGLAAIAFLRRRVSR